MIQVYFRQFSLFVILFTIVLLCMLAATGCQQTNPGSELNPAAINTDRDFQKQGDIPPTSQTLLAMADILSAQGRDKDCEFVLKRIIREYPKFLPAYNSLAELQMRQGQVNAAIETINNAFRINPDDPLLQNNLGVCWIVTGQYEKALEIFTKAAGERPENARYRMNMAVALALMGRYDESLSLFRQVLPEEQANYNLNILKEHGENALDASDIQKSS